MKNKIKEFPISADTAIRMRLRSIYLKGHQDALTKTSDISWEDTIVNELISLFRKWKKEL